MAQKTINTRLKLKYDTLANWNKIASTFIPLKGEVCFVEVADNTDPIHNAPSILFKVGDGTSTFSALKWGSGLAADVYSWAKAATKPSYTYDEISGTPTIPTVGNGKITITQNGKEMGSFTVNQSGPATIEVKDTNTDTNTSYQLVLSGHTLKLQSKEKGASEWVDVTGQSFTLPDNNTTYTFAEGTANGAFSVTPSGGSATSVKVHGLKSAAYTDSSAYATAAQGTKADSAVQTVAAGTANGTIAVDGKNVAVTGLKALAYKASLGKADVGLGNVENKTLDTAVKASSGNYITSGAVKTYVDNAINAVHQFQYEVVDTLPTASASTMGKIYLKAHTHNPSDGQPDSYDEFITLEEGTTTKTYRWERIGNTDINLSNYYTKDQVNTELGKKQNNLNADQLKAVNSGITNAKVAAYDGYSAKITALEAKPGLDKVGTLTGVKMNGKAVSVSGGVADIGTVITAHQDISGKQDKIIAGSHITIGADGKTVNATWPTASDTGYAGIGKTGTVTSVALKGSTYVTVDNTAAITSSGTRTISLSSKVLTEDDTLILDCGSSTVNI